jgi:nitrite reductase/ring-hydroxylating ferredoxin subunit
VSSDAATPVRDLAVASVPFGTPVTQLSTLQEGIPKVVAVGGHELLLIRQGHEVHATSNVCPHRGGPLAEGEVRDGIITCPWHRFRYDARTGVCVTNPNLQVATYRVVIVGDDVIVTHHEQQGETE